MIVVVVVFISWREEHSSTGRLVTGRARHKHRDGAEYKIEHNSLNFRARSPKFCMQVDLDRPQPFKQSIKLQKSTEVLITQPFVELQTPDFAWKFIWTV